MRPRSPVLSIIPSATRGPDSKLFIDLIVIPILGVAGKPIKANGGVPIAEPSVEEVDELHSLLCERMIELFNKYKGFYGWENKTLVIV